MAPGRRGAGARRCRSTSEAMQRMIHAQLEEVGIETVARAEPDRVLWGSEMRKRAFDGIVLSSDSHSPGIIPWNQYATAAIPAEGNSFTGQKHDGYSNPRLDVVLRAAYNEVDPPKR